MKSRKTVLITGSAKRLGAMLARSLHTQGFSIIVHYLNSESEALKLVEQLNQACPDSAVGIQADLRKPQELNRLVDQSIQKFGRLDGLINNASVFEKTKVGQLNDAIWDDLINTNLKAPYYLSQLCLPHLKQSQGCIINLTDIHIEQPFRDYAVYCLTKAGLANMTRALAKEFAPEVRVNAVSPGMIAWPEAPNELTPALKEKIINNTALKRIGSFEDITKAILFLMNDADFMTGQVITVDGGRLL